MFAARKRHVCGCAIAISAFATLARPALAQTTGPQSPPLAISRDVIVTASVAPTSFGSLTRTVLTITREDLDRLGVTSLTAGLRLLPGLDARARGPRDVQTDFSIRGATFGQALVLVDGWRLNDSQSGHHNGDLPVALAGLDRIELLAGAGSAVHGADALGGTINILSRRDAHARLSVAAGAHGYVSVEGSTSGQILPEGWTVTGWGSRSGGFTFDRDFAIGGASLAGPLTSNLRADVRHLHKAFGANGFYGNSPSKEWTDQTLAGLSWSRAIGAWTTEARGQYRRHGDHFRWDINRPGFAENRHGTDAVDIRASANRVVGARTLLAFGASAGGDWIQSSNLGDWRDGHGAAFGEMQWTPTTRSAVQAGLRVDRYSRFGTAWNPSLSAGTWISSAFRVRASASHAFRIPTYTELYYRDPAHLARPDLSPERGWTADGGLDWTARGWLVSVSPYRRWDEDVIDWVKAQPADLWRTTNVRDVTTTGLEVSALGRVRQALVRGFVTTQTVDAPSLNLLSKYVLEFVTRSAGLSVAAPLAAGLQGAVTIDHRRRFGGQPSTVVDLRIGRSLGRSTVYVDVANLFDEDYVEIVGVSMPGRWVTVGMTLR